jgi:hypothetical protein
MLNEVIKNLTVELSRNLNGDELACLEELMLEVERKINEEVGAVNLTASPRQMFYTVLAINTASAYLSVLIGDMQKKSSNPEVRKVIEILVSVIEVVEDAKYTHVTRKAS